VLGTSCFGNILAKSPDSCDELWTGFAPAVTDIITKHPRAEATSMFFSEYELWK
jgi:hypothetical protein